MEYVYKTKMVCAQIIKFGINDNIITNINTFCCIISIIFK